MICLAIVILCRGTLEKNYLGLKNKMKRFQTFYSITLGILKAQIQQLSYSCVQNLDAVSLCEDYSRNRKLSRVCCL